jgi:hypothetical protein
MTNRYPIIRIRSKNELAKRLVGKGFNFDDSLKLINDVLKNYDKYWKDNDKSSDIKKQKYVRNAKKTPLGKLLKLIDKKILKPNDHLFPDFIFGGVSKKDHVKAAYYLLGTKKNRTKLGLDVTKFFENNHQERVFYFFYDKCECSKIGANLLAKLCCVPIGPKGSETKERTLARGFATSTRLATWVNIDLFLKISWVTKKLLKNNNVKIAIFIDDIGITASQVKRSDMEELADKIKDILDNHYTNHSLPLNTTKTNIQNSKKEPVEHLGLRLGRNKITPGKKTIYNQNELHKKLHGQELTINNKRKLIKIKKSYSRYKAYIRSFNTNIQSTR